MNLSRKQWIIGLIVSAVVILATTITLVVLSGSKNYMEEAMELVDYELVDRGYEHNDTLVLPEKYQDIDIEWQSTDLIINDNGLVNSIGLTSDVEVKIVVTFDNGEEERTKEYFVTVYMINGTDTNVDCAVNPNHPTCDGDISLDQQKINLVKTNMIVPSTTMTDLVLVTTSNGVDISWASDNGAISSTGEITRSLSQDITVNLTATFTSGDTTDTRIFTVVVSKINVLDEAKDALTLPNETTTDLYLPTSLNDDFVVTVSWASNNSAIQTTGVVTSSNTEDVTVTLTATLSYNSQTETKQFIVTVPKDSTLDEVYDLLEVPELVVRNLYLPTSLNNVSISWNSANTSVLSNQGEVNKTNQEETFTVEATLTYNGEDRTKTFNVTVAQLPANQLGTPYGFVWIGDQNFFAYAVISEEGYSGMMLAILTTPGEEPIYFTNSSTGGNLSMIPILDQIANGKEYTVTFIALGDGVNYEDSEPAGPLVFTIDVDPLEQATNVDITDSVLTWDEIENADSYEVYATIEGGSRTLLGTLYDGDVLSMNLPVQLGRYQVEIVAKGLYYSESITEVEYLKSSDTLITLDTPVISNDEETDILTWNAIPNVTEYEIKVGNTVMTTTNTSFDLHQITSIPDSYTVTVKAKGDLIVYTDSSVSNSVNYTITTPTPKVDASGLLWQNNIGGHYSIERPGYVDPEGWVQYQYIVRIYDGDTLLNEDTFDNASPVVHIQVPGVDGMLTDLDPGTYTVHVIMVGNQTTHADSEPAIFTLEYAG